MNAFNHYLELRRLRPREVSILHKVRQSGVDTRCRESGLENKALT